MSTIIVGILGLAWLVGGYFWYTRRLDRRIISPNDYDPTPAVTVNDRVDYVPTHPMILFGHHFSSIAGAGPIVGPILAFSLFGWLPALIWVLVGSVFIGAVHDYATLMISVRNRGISIVEIAADAVSRTARWIFSVFVWFALILVQAVFAVLTAQTLTEKPEIALPTLGLIPLAMVFGWLVYRRGANLAASTGGALAVIVLLIIAGEKLPVVASYDVWLGVIVAYAFTAAVLPVWVLLQPRDYLSVYILIGGLILGFVGLAVSHPPINAPAVVDTTSTQGPIWPMLFIIVACGAVSGFHSLVASGTTAKQLRRESDGRKIAFGGMVTEGALAVMVILLIAGALYWVKAPSPALSGFVFQELLAKSANIVFGTALGRVLESIGIPLAIGSSFGVLMLNAFILTTLDTTVRLSRYIVQETAGARVRPLANKYLAAGLGLIVAYLLCRGESWKSIWPVFGAANQLVAALALMVASAYLFARKKPTAYTLIPAVFMTVTTVGALIYQLFWTFLPGRQWLLSAIAVTMMMLGLTMTFEVVRRFRATARGTTLRPAGIPAGLPR